MPKPGQKLNALPKVTSYIDVPKRCMLLNAFYIPIPLLPVNLDVS